LNKGILFALGAYSLWGILPLFWKLLEEVPAFQILCHRISWSLIFLISIQVFGNKLRWIKKAIKSKKIVLTFLTTSILLSTNWFTYIWAVNNGRTIEGSLGYFINPLFTVVLGVVFLKERPDKWSWLAIGLAGLGIIYTVVIYGAIPWIALVLTFTFGLYGLLRKQAALNSLQGLSFEAMILFLPSTAILTYFEFKGVGFWGHLPVGNNILLALAGIATSVPLLLFAAAARRIELISLGILQYIAPILQFLIGLLIFREEFNQNNLIGLSF